MERKIICGNWKCNGTFSEVLIIISNILKSYNGQNDVIICVPNIYIQPIHHYLWKQNNIYIGSQDVSIIDKCGPYTGEVTASMLKDIGASYTIIGHSERRSLFMESDNTILVKIKNALNAELKVILCIGETLEEFNNKQTYEVCINQLKPIFFEIFKKYEYFFVIESIIIAYEPLWSIGTGNVATPKIINDTNTYIKDWIFQNFNFDIKILYGGSVKLDNASLILETSNVDGLLVGGASLTPEFSNIINV